ncbi:hypothetical protein niasHS_014856 [Heterodera schachtii]|uniref:GDP-fucose pyrophosphorylase domain-containing protein n=1 Tax=Heterodera schachtii TaxID=97005 RepID=A0ABD2IG27_HETSC
MRKDTFEIAADENELCHCPKWNIFVLTARNAAQKEQFELELRRLRLIEQNFCDQIFVLEDSPVNAKIGSGGATLNALLFLFESFGGEVFFAQNRVLLLHSGGLSQRIFHVALTGKAFMLLPDVPKCHSFVFGPLLLSVHSSLGFVFVASADVLEHFPPAVSVPSFPGDLLLIAHQSLVEVAEGHGVYLLGGNSNDSNGQSQKLKRVLQKPTAEEIRRENAILKCQSEGGEELVLTDSCYLLGHGLAVELALLRRKMEAVPLNELCCYRDFLCPLGFASEEQRKAHFKAKVPELLQWQSALWDLMHNKEAHLLDLGTQSFFHFGTPSELLSHFYGHPSIFREKFLHNGKIENILYSKIGDKKKISAESFLEWCDLNENCEVGKECILSGLVYDGDSLLRIGNGICASTFPIERKPSGGHAADNSAVSAFVTVAFHRDDDIKRSSAECPLLWFGHRLASVAQGHAQFHSLWHFPLFSAHPNPSESLRETVDTINRLGQNEPQKSDKTKPRSNQQQLLSIEEVLQKVDAKKLREMREKFIKMPMEEKENGKPTE